MLRVTVLCSALILGSAPALAGERVFDFDQYPLNQTPPGFRSVISGHGQPGNWRVVVDEGASSAASGAKPAASQVLAQLARDTTDEHFPMLLFDEEAYGDFTLTTRLKLVEGSVEQMAGIAFRVQDTNNYYYVRLSALGNTFRFIKLVNGQRLTTVGPSVEIQAGVWHELTIDCKGNRIHCLLDGKELIPPLTDNTFTAGRIAFWTKSDTVAHFGQTKIHFTRYETLAQILVREAMKKYPRLLGVRVYARVGESQVPKIVASNFEDEIGTSGGRVEQDVMDRDVVYYGKQDRVALVTMPLHDRNGDVAAAVRITMQSFVGQTEQNAVARAQPVVRQMEKRIRSAKDLMQ
jgi:hypothetical protein